MFTKQPRQHRHRHPHALSFSLLLFVTLIYKSSSNSSPTTQGCTVCSDGLAVPFPNKPITIPGFSFIQTCGLLDTTLPIILTNKSSNECQTIQKLGSLCGCQITQNGTEGCDICPNGIPNPTKPVPALNHLFLGFEPTCEILHAYTLSFPKKSGICSAAESFIAPFCGCNYNNSDTLFEAGCTLCPSGTDNITLPNRTLNIDGFPFDTCKQLDNAMTQLLPKNSTICSQLQQLGTYCGCPVPQRSCQMCPNRGEQEEEGEEGVEGTTNTTNTTVEASNIAYPEKKARFASDFFGGFTPNCAILEAYTRNLDPDSDTCHLIQQGSGFCGCPPISEDHCIICQGGDPPAEYLEREIPPQFVRAIGIGETEFPLTCELGLAFQYQLESDSYLCDLARSRSDICGCSAATGGTYLGASTVSEKAALAWVPRIVGFLSLLGGISIVFDVLSDTKRRKNLYNHLVLALAIFDLVSAIAWALSTLANPTDDLFPLYGERGNKMTCKVQGFLMQLGLTSILYNVSLCIYYLLVIGYQWRISRLRRIRIFLLFVPAVVGFVLAFAGMPYYDTVIYACHIPPPPIGASYVPCVALIIVPVLSVIGFVTFVMGYMYYRVRSQAQAAQQWRFSFRTRQQNTPNQDGVLRIPPTSDDTSDLNSRGRDGSTNESTSRGRRRRGGKVSKLEKEVLWQSLFYVSAFYVAWPLLTVTLFRSHYRQPLIYWISLLIVAPSQGILNALVYFRPRMKRNVHRKKQHRAHLATSNSGTQELSSVNSIFSSFLGRLISKTRRSEELNAAIEGRIAAMGESREGNEENLDGGDFDSTFEPSAAIAGHDMVGETAPLVLDVVPEERDEEETAIGSPLSDKERPSQIRSGHR